MRFSLARLREMFPLLEILEDVSYNAEDNIYTVLVTSIEGLPISFELTSYDIRRHL